MDDSDPAWPPALARNSRLSPPSARSPLTAQARTGSAHHLIGPPAPDRLSLPLSLCLFVCALNSRARSLLSFSLPCPVMLPSQRLACMITPGHGRPTQHGPSHPARSTRAVCTPHRPRPDPPALVGGDSGPGPAWFTQALGTCAHGHSAVFSIFAFMDLACPLV
jgi:hypothetical protein